MSATARIVSARRARTLRRRGVHLKFVFSTNTGKARYQICR